MRQLLLRLRRLQADARLALDALDAVVKIRMINAAECAVQSRRGLLRRLEQQRAAALTAASKARAYATMRSAANAAKGDGGIVAFNRLAAIGTASIVGPRAGTAKMRQQTLQRTFPSQFYTRVHDGRRTR